ncbi:MAG: hypothetical protein M3O02_12880 [Acidobacteriota bacterium]|nr:hypothetical protein [Acidobacteriota bacterium]
MLYHGGMEGVITPWQLWAAMGMPTVVALLGILSNRRDSERLEDRLNRRIDGLDKRIDGLEGRINQQSQIFHQDVISLIKMHQEHETRLTRLEERS